MANQDVLYLNVTLAVGVFEQDSGCWHSTGNNLGCWHSIGNNLRCWHSTGNNLGR